MFTYNGQPILDQSSLFSESDLNQMDREIMFGLARSTSSFFSPGYELTRGDAEIELYNHDYKDVGIANSELRDDEKDEYEKLTFIEQQRYLRFAKGAYHPWSVCLPLTTMSAWGEKMYPADKAPTIEAKRLFPQTLKMLYSIPIFKAIGRICIFGIDPKQHVTCHRDEDPATWKLNDELLMISPRGNKKFYVYDPEKREKHFAPDNSHAYIFHDLNYHGVEPLPYFTYSVRVDGIYTDEFRSTLVCNREAVHPNDYLKWKESSK